MTLQGTAEIASGHRFADTTVGGLSALAYDARSGRYLALSDDRGDREPVRFYELAIPLSESGAPGPVRVLSVVPLRAVGLGPGAIDPEGLALVADGMWIASEGVAADGIAPFVRLFGRDGAQLGELALPPEWTPVPGRGVRDNLGPESLTVSPDGSRLFVATEAAAVQDGPVAGFERSSPVRLAVYDSPSMRPLAQHLYPVAPVAVRPAEPEGFFVNGLVELLALSPSRLLALERAWAAGGGYSLVLYEVDLAAADDVASLPALADAPPARPVNKRRVLDLTAALAAAGVAPDNLEGLSFGPRLADGRRTVVVVGDDNFNRYEQRTLFVVLALDARR